VGKYVTIVRRQGNCYLALNETYSHRRKDFDEFCKRAGMTKKRRAKDWLIPPKVDHCLVATEIGTIMASDLSWERRTGWRRLFGWIRSKFSL
jgi:hypothetical protein